MSIGFGSFRSQFDRCDTPVGNDRNLRIPAEDRSCREGSLGIATVDGTVFGKASYTLNVIGRDTDEDSCAVPDAGICSQPFLSHL